jgi:3-isopropylmalate/(R)-2-methylmalate dehydratase small subunit
VPVLVDDTTSAWLLANPGADVTIDLESTTLTLPNGARVSFPLEPFARYCLMNGVDELGFLLSKQPEIDAYERRRSAA